MLLFFFLNQKCLLQKFGQSFNWVAPAEVRPVVSAQDWESKNGKGRGTASAASERCNDVPGLHHAIPHHHGEPWVSISKAWHQRITQQQIYVLDVGHGCRGTTEAASPTRRPPSSCRTFPCDITAPPSAAAARERRARGGSGGAQPRQPTRSLAAATTHVPNREVAGGHFRLRKKPQTLQEAGLGSTESPASTPSLRRRRRPEKPVTRFCSRSENHF